MARGPRTIAQSGCYHIVQRGNGQQIIFENPSDYRHFLELLKQYKESLDFKLHAYCLMENHFHLLIQTKASLSNIIQVLLGCYSHYYNTKYQRTGHLFQGRFYSEIIDSQDYFFNVIQYIHLNPARSNICAAANYPWSSYQDYIGTSILTDTELLYKLISGKEAFLELMNRNISEKCLDIQPTITDVAAISIIQNELGLANGSQLLSMNKKERNRCLQFLKRKKLSIRQISRLTGISKSVIGRV